MHAYLIVGGNPQEKLSDLFDTNWSKLDFSAENIEEIRDIVQFTTLSVTGNTLVQIYNLEKATLEAQNTLLKTLEEPQDNLKFAIITRDAENIIETIRSRCQLIETSTAQKKINTNLTNFFELGVGDKLLLLSKIKKRDEAIVFLEELITSTHKELIEGKVSAKNLETAVEVLENIKANGNVSLHLTLLALEEQTS